LVPQDPSKSSVQVTSLALVSHHNLLPIGWPSNTESIYNTTNNRVREKLHLREIPTRYKGVHGIVGLFVTASGIELFAGGLGVPVEAISLTTLTTLFMQSLGSQDGWIGYPHIFGVIGNDKIVVNRTFGLQLHHGFHYQLIPHIAVAATCSAQALTAVVHNSSGHLTLYNQRWHLLRSADVQGCGDDISKICFSVDGKAIAGLTYHSITVWNAATLQVIGRLAVGSTSITLSPAGRMLAVAVQNRVDLFDTNGMLLLASRSLGWRITTSMQFSSNASRLFTADGDRVYVLNVPSLSTRSIIHLK
jgi:DNA-binding beta-propeller fold protein YncE